ncbi:MAG: endolytic transglycosylase MltG [Chitinophagaceae bacterium]|nr:endolytic transglycosylase MltG [Chitinophagaceae bacterium]
MKKLIQLTGIVLLIAAAFLLWITFGAATNFSEPKKYLYIRSGNVTKEALLSTLEDSSFLSRNKWFEFIATKWNLWPKLKAGKFEIKKGESVFSLVRKLRNNQQVQVNLVITKLRTKKDFAALVGRRFECDSATFYQYITGDAVKRRGVDSNTFMTLLIPNTYSYYWTASPQTIIARLEEYNQKFWNNERLQKAAALNLTKEQVYILASIVEEETLQNDEKSTISSVYLNRLHKNMYLGADPTVKFALGDFSIKRLYFGHINSSAASPYNTYKNKGLPPGPICTPQAVTIDAVLDTKPTNYLFFCAKPNSNGHHAFAENEKEHFQNAKIYQDWLNANKIQ